MQRLPALLICLTIVQRSWQEIDLTRASPKTM